METTGEKQALIFIESKKTRTGSRVTETSCKTGIGSEWKSVTVNVLACFENLQRIRGAAEGRPIRNVDESGGSEEGFRNLWNGCPEP